MVKIIINMIVNVMIKVLDNLVVNFGGKVGFTVGGTPMDGMIDNKFHVNHSYIIRGININTLATISAIMFTTYFSEIFIISKCAESIASTCLVWIYLHYTPIPQTQIGLF